MFDKRKNERGEFLDYKVEYTVDHLSTDEIFEAADLINANELSHNEIFEADLINFNEIGLCMLSPYRLTVDQEITLRNFMGFSSRTAVVIWVVEVEKTGGFDKSDQVLFKAGLKFLD